MSSEGRQRSLSPSQSHGVATSSTRSSLIPVDEEPQRQEKSYRRYASGIERAITLFDAPHLEWPDYISGLGRLLKAIQAHPAAFDTLPHRVAVAHRLSQCLNPTLPSGVHLKAIEVYSYLFSTIGKDALARDLAIYLPGLSSVLSFASLSVRPYFLSLFETYISVLDGHVLRPALKALILCLLPSLDEETSGDFERTITIVDRLKQAVNTRSARDDSVSHGFGDEFFWQCMFLACISSASRRQGALAFFLRRLPKLGRKPAAKPNDATDIDERETVQDLPADAEALVSPEPGLLIRCFAAGLEDDQILVQRAFLDILLTHLPLDSPVLTQRVNAADLTRLVTAAINVVGRRDMSLNRRLWLWLLGVETLEETEGTTIYSPSTSSNFTNSTKDRETSSPDYFAKYGLRSLINSILGMFDSTHSAPVLTKTFRLCLSLMDRWEIGKLLIPEVFTPLMSNLLEYRVVASQDEFREVFRSASSFFDGIESGVIWGQIMELVTSSLCTDLHNETSGMHGLDLADFIVSHFNVREEEMLTSHIPLVSLLIMSILDQLETEDNAVTAISPDAVRNALNLVEKLVLLMPSEEYPNRLPGKTSTGAATSSEDLDEEQIINSIQTFYRVHKGNTLMPLPPLSTQALAELLLSKSGNLMLRSLNCTTSIASTLDIRSRIVSTVVNIFANHQSIIFDRIIVPWQQAFHQLKIKKHSLPFSTLTSTTLVLSRLVTKSPDTSKAMLEKISNLTATLVEAAWSYLTPSYPRHHVEAVRCLWQIDDLNVDDCVVEAAVSAFITGGQHTSEKVECARRFAVMWTHTTHMQDANTKRREAAKSPGTAHAMPDCTIVKDHYTVLRRPLLLLLDALNEEATELGYFVISWLESLPDPHAILDLILKSIVTTQVFQSTLENKDRDGDGSFTSPQQRHQDDSGECQYYLQHLLNILKLSSNRLWANLLSGAVNQQKSFQVSIAEIALQLLRTQPRSHEPASQSTSSLLYRTALSIIHELLQGPDTIALKQLSLDEVLVDILEHYLVGERRDPAVQIALLDTTLATLKLRTLASKRPQFLSHRHGSSMAAVLTLSKISLHDDEDTVRVAESSHQQLPSVKLMKCLQHGVVSAASSAVLDHWIDFLIAILPLWKESLFQHLIPLVETLCNQVQLLFQQLHANFSSSVFSYAHSPEQALFALLTGVEHVLAAGHDRLTMDEYQKTLVRSPEQQHGFFGNAVSAPDFQKSVTSMANARLTVLLCFQDAVRICLSIWSWNADEESPGVPDISCAASFGYISTRLRNKARRILDRIFAAEALETLEVLIVAWARQESFGKVGAPPSVLNLLQVLDASRPKNTVPAIFNAIYSRNNPSAIEPGRTSSLTSDITDVELGQFLVEYTQSLDDDAVGEIWSDCMIFLRDVLTSPAPHQLILPNLLVFLLSLSKKVDNTNFGEQRKMRKDLSDLFTRLLAAIFNTKYSPALQEPLQAVVEGEHRSSGDSARPRSARQSPRYSDLIKTLSSVVPQLPLILSENDRLVSVASTISIHILGPTLHSKNFPNNLNVESLNLLYNLTGIAQASKIWKKDVADGLNNPRFFSTSPRLVIECWLPILQRWTVSDKDRFSDLVSRIASPTTAGLVFGVGAGAARLEADKRTQFTLRRLAVLILANDYDFVVPHLEVLGERLSELVSATLASSPSAVTRAEVFMLIRAIVTKTSSVHLASFWLIISTELYKAISSALPGSKDFDTYNVLSLLQACKLLDTLLSMAPEEFQTHEWLFITDTIDAVYRPTHWEPVGLVDQIAEDLNSAGPLPTPTTPNAGGELQSARTERSRHVLFTLSGEVAGTTKEQFIRSTLRPFFSQLSIHAFETMYSMAPPDFDVFQQSLLTDLFDERTMTG